MKNAKKLIAVILAVAVVMGFTGCSKKATAKSFANALEACEIEQTNDLSKIAQALSMNGGYPCYYVAEDEDEAGELGDVVLNRFSQMPDFDAKEFIVGLGDFEGSDGKHHATMLCFMVLESEKKAEKAYDNLVEHYADHDETKDGKSGGYTYTLEAAVSAAGTTDLGTGIYLQGDTVIYIRAISTTGDGFDIADKFCGKLGLVSPSKAL